MAVRVIQCVGALVYDDAGRLLMIRRGHDPDRGRWSLPGGRIEAGESDTEALVREVREETGLAVEVDDLVGSVELESVHGATAQVRDYRCRLPAGTDPGSAIAGDDADDVGWFAGAELLELDCSAGLLDALRDWGALPG
jgi:ADP-ribose pyrophosphatase YjhB (NUDIX family)